VEEQVNLLTDIRNVTKDVESMIQKNVVTNATPIYALTHWVEQVKTFSERIKLAKSKTNLVQDNLNRATEKLYKFNQECMNQIELHQKNIREIYNIEELSSYSDIANWQQKIAALLLIFADQDRDVEDLKLVQKQLDLIEQHFKKLNSDTLTEEELALLVQKCYQENDEFFIDDAPPLDHETIYENMVEAVKEKRARIAQEWLMSNIIKQDLILKYDAQATSNYLARIRKFPPTLSASQRQLVQEIILICEKRLDELEVEGVLVRFKGLSERNKDSFIKRIFDYMQKVAATKEEDKGSN
jgi:hypothetical protein